MTRVGNRIHTKTKTLLRMGRMEQPVEMELRESAVEHLMGGLISFESFQILAKMKMVTRGSVADGKVVLTTSQFGVENKREVAYPDGAVFKSWGMFRESLLRGFEPGSSYELSIYEPSLKPDGAVKASTIVGDWEQVDINGVDTRAQRVSVTMATPMGSLTMISWIDKDGNVKKSRVPMPGLGDMVVIAADQATALADFVAPELFLNTTVRVNRSLDAKRLQQVTYRLSWPGNENEELKLPETGMQRVVGRSNRTIDLHVRRHDDAGPKSESPANEYLEPNLMINIADPELVALAKRAAGDLTDPKALAHQLRVFVTDYVADKNLGIGFATASEVCRNREGDCSEHAVLLAALGRLCGIPSRVVVGLVYLPVLGGQTDVFGYHMWTQFFVDGQWLDLDAAMRETDVSPVHIVFATSSLQSSGLADLSFSVLDKLGSLSIEVLDAPPEVVPV